MGGTGSETGTGLRTGVWARDVGVWQKVEPMVGVKLDVSEGAMACLSAGGMGTQERHE